MKLRCEKNWSTTDWIASHERSGLANDELFCRPSYKPIDCAGAVLTLEQNKAILPLRLFSQVKMIRLPGKASRARIALRLRGTWADTPFPHPAMRSRQALDEIKSSLRTVLFYVANALPILVYAFRPRQHGYGKRTLHQPPVSALLGSICRSIPLQCVAARLKSKQVRSALAHGPFF
jgi:hypothetical protein